MRAPREMFLAPCLLGEKGARPFARGVGGCEKVSRVRAREGSRHHSLAQQTRCQGFRRALIQSVFAQLRLTDVLVR